MANRGKNLYSFETLVKYFFDLKDIRTEKFSPLRGELPPLGGKTEVKWSVRSLEPDTDDSLARNEILTDDEIIRTVTAEGDDDDNFNPVKISHSEAVAALNISLQWAEEQNFEAHDASLMLLRDRAFELKIGTAAQKKKKKKSLTFLDTDYVHSLTYVVIMYVHIMFDQFIHAILVHTNIP
ncbi:hypothetical protein AVEN_164108-1 [Araneus ventricosus]|uniref:Uncharacterized protein n=1 Tax=Araneus ventricosus TaxID=182803 RepID=A0A4Y2NP40_ARAVE|nr:hypothetical protein AVEN_164108-1 [Araneus ventricosus]